MENVNFRSIGRRASFTGWTFRGESLLYRIDVTMRKAPSFCWENLAFEKKSLEKKLATRLHSIFIRFFNGGIPWVQSSSTSPRMMSCELAKGSGRKWVKKLTLANEILWGKGWDVVHINTEWFWKSKKTARKCWHIQCSTCTKSSICIHFSSWNDLLHHLHSGSRTPKKTAVSARKPKNCMWKPQICHATNSCNSWSHLVPNECCTWIKWSSSEQNQVTLILFPQVFPKKMRQ